jgi:hypothetical protein
MRPFPRLLGAALGLLVATGCAGAATAAHETTGGVAVLDQRNKAYDAETKSDLRNAAIAEETYFTDHQAYATSLGELAQAGFSATAAAQVTIVARGPNGYCLQETSQSGSTWSYDPARTAPITQTPCV